MTNANHADKTITLHVIYAVDPHRVEILVDDFDVPADTAAVDLGTRELARVRALAAKFPTAAAVEACELTDAQLVPVGRWPVVAGVVDRFDLSDVRGTLVLE